MSQPTKGLSYQAARLRALGKRRGGTWLQARIWDWEFKAGRWDCLNSAGADTFYPLLLTRLAGGRLLDLGCGNGTVRCEMPSDSMCGYVGVDIAPEAIRQAEQRTAALSSLEHGQRFLVGDIADPAVLSSVGKDFDVVLLRECLMFVDMEEVDHFLTELCALLSARGVIMVRIWDRDRYASHVEAVRRVLDVFEEQTPEGKQSIFMVARPRG